MPAGRLADLLGRRRIFFVGLGLFLAASALCGLAPTAEVLIGARVIQAAGAALLVPTSLGLLLPEFPPERRASATALWGAIGGVAAATGPSLGGLLIEWTDWRLVFFVNLALGAVAARAGAAAAARDARPGPRRRAGRAGDRAAGGRRGGAVARDRRGAGLGLGRPRGCLAAFAGGVVLLALFVWRSVAHPHPVLELSLFRVRSFAAACAGVGVFALGFYAVLLANILFLTSVWGYSILQAGFAVTPGPLMAATSSALAGRMIDRYGQRVSAVPGGLLFAAGCVLFATGLGDDPAYVTSFLPATILTGMGVGLSFAGWSSAAVAELPPARFATGSAISSCFRQLGAVLGISVLIAIVGDDAGPARLPPRVLADGGHGCDSRADRADLAARSRYRPDMDLEERTLDDTIARTCAVCGAKLTTQEIKDAREEGGPFLCTVHAMEEVPAEDDV